MRACRYNRQLTPGQPSRALKAHGRFATHIPSLLFAGSRSVSLSGSWCNGLRTSLRRDHERKSTLLSKSPAGFCSTLVILRVPITTRRGRRGEREHERYALSVRTL